MLCCCSHSSSALPSLAPRPHLPAPCLCSRSNDTPHLLLLRRQTKTGPQTLGVGVWCVVCGVANVDEGCWSLLPAPPPPPWQWLHAPTAWMRRKPPQVPGQVPSLCIPPYLRSSSPLQIRLRHEIYLCTNAASVAQKAARAFSSLFCGSSICCSGSIRSFRTVRIAASRPTGASLHQFPPS